MYFIIIRFIINYIFQLKGFYGFYFLNLRVYVALLSGFDDNGYGKLNYTKVKMKIACN